MKRCLIEIKFNVAEYNFMQNDQVLEQQLSYQNITLPEPVYDYVYAGQKPIPLVLRDIKTYVRQIQQGIERFEEEYEVRSCNHHIY